MRVLALLACLVALLAPVLSAREALAAVAAESPDALVLVPADGREEVETRAAVNNATTSCLEQLGGLPKLLGVDDVALDNKAVPWRRWYWIWCCHKWCWCRCWFWWCPWWWFHHHGFLKEAQQVLQCTAKANNVLPEAQRLDVDALEKTLLDKFDKLDDTTKKTLGLDEEPVARE